MLLVEQTLTATVMFACTREGSKLLLLLLLLFSLDIQMVKLGTINMMLC